MSNLKHGANINGRRTKLYQVWLNMRNKCTNPNHDRYKWYGARGIKVCERWNDFPTFRDDLGEPPNDGQKYTLDRIDTNGDYEPGNVRWATWTQQANNKRNNRLVTLLDGRTMSVAQAAKATGIKRVTINARLKLGWPDYMVFAHDDFRSDRLK